MRKTWVRSLALSLGLVATGARGQEALWRSSPGGAVATSPPAAALARPIAIASSKPAATPTSPPAVTLGRPQAIARTPSHDEALQPASFTPARDPLAPVARGRAPDAVTPRPMPPGPTADPAAMPSPGYSLWRRADDVVASTVSRNGGETAAPPVPGPGTLVPPTPVVPGPTLISPPPGFGMPAANAPANTPVPAGPFPPPVVMNGPAANGPGVHPTPCATCTSPLPGPHPAVAMPGPWGGAPVYVEPRITLGFEYLYWWLSGDNTPALVNAAPPGTALASTAFTNVLSGNDAFASQPFSGGRIRGAYWFSDRHCWALEGSAFFLAEQQDDFFAQSDGISQRQLGRPFFNLTPGTTPGPVSEIVAGGDALGRAIGNVAVNHRTSLWGFDANLRRNLWLGEIWTVDLFFGYRQLGLQDDLSILENVVVTQNLNAQLNPNQPGTAFSIRDQFSTSNRFYGGQIGLDTALRFGDWTIGLRGSVALGCTQQTIDITGTTTRILPGAAATAATGGLLALQGTNIGRYTQRFFGVVPEVGLTLGWDLFDWMRLSCGYNFLYWNQVARAGEQIDNGVNLSYAPFPPAGIAAGQGARRPLAGLNSSDLFIHGVTFGIEFRY